MCDQIKSPFRFNSLYELTDYFKDEKTCLDFLEEWLWEGDIKCQQCGYGNAYRYKDGKTFKCKNCRTIFTAKVGTIFQKTTLPLRKWFMAIYLVSSHKKGISSCQLARDIGVTQKTAWFMLHRIRSAFAQGDVKLEGIVSSDEAIVGGRNQNRHKNKRMVYSATGRNFKDKVPVLGMMEKDGLAKTVVLPAMEHKLIRQHVLTTVKHGSVLVTDEYGAYKKMKRFYEHHVNNHQRGQYASKEGYSSNNIEGFWSILKRMIMGIYHKTSRKHLQKYCDELTFRFNTRKESESSRFAMVLSRIKNTLTYKQLVYG